MQRGCKYNDFFSIIPSFPAHKQHKIRYFDIFILYCSRLLVTLTLSKLLSLDNNNKKSDFYFVLFSLTRNFALKTKE